jgi:hypothetical protein
MSHFYGDLQGSRGEATRCGTAWSGISSHVRGWHVGARASMRVEDGQDVASIAATHGSAGSGSEAVGSVRLDESGTLVLEPSAWTVGQVQRWQRAERKRLRAAAKLAAREARRERYRKLRASQPYYSAATAWHYASQPEPPALDWTDTDYGAGRAATVQVSGYRVELGMRADYDADYWTAGKFTDTWSADAVAMPEPRERGTYRYWLPDVSYREHVAGLRKLGYARHAADCLARQYVRQDLAAAIAGRELVCVHATAYLAGVELGSSAIHGVELGSTYGTDSTPLERQLDAIVVDYGLVSEAVSEAKSARAKLVAPEGI